MQPNKIGPGPISSASQFSVTKRLDKAGEFAFAMPGSDEKASYIQAKRGISINAIPGNPTNGSVLTYIGGGIIDSISKKPGDDGTVTLAVSGSDPLRLLTRRTIVGAFQNHDAVDALATLAANYAPGWTFNPDPLWIISPVTIYMSFSGETVLACVIKIAEKLGAHVYLSGRRTLQCQITPDDSGIRAIQMAGSPAAETCAIMDLEEVSDSYDLVTRIIPYGAGQGNARLTLAASNATPPAGYTLSTAQNYLSNDAAETEYGIAEQRVEFKDIAPLSNTDADMQAAANSLYESAKIWLDLNTTPHKAYRLKIAGCNQVLRPMQTIKVVYRGDNLELNDDLLILESTVRGDTNEVYTTDLVVSNLARWPASDAGAVVDTVKQSNTFIAHPQLNANAYTTGYTKTVDASFNATFRFRFGNEVTQLQQVLFEFQILPLESTAKTLGGSASGSATLPAHKHTVHIDDHTHNVRLTGAGSPTGSHPFATLVYFDPTDSELYFTAGDGDAGTSTSGDGGAQTPTSDDPPTNIPITINISNALSLVHGIFRADPADTFGINDLEYSVNGGAWIALNTAITVDTGWYQLDITALVQNSTTFRPLLTSNHLDIRKAAAAASKTANIDALLSVRNTIQAINYV